MTTGPIPHFDSKLRIIDLAQFATEYFGSAGPQEAIVDRQIRNNLF